MKQMIRLPGVLLLALACVLSLALPASASGAELPLEGLPHFGAPNGGPLPSDAAGAYAQALRDLPEADGFYRDYELVYFTTLIACPNGAPMLWVVPALKTEEWMGEREYFQRDAESYMGLDHMLFTWTGSEAVQVPMPFDVLRLRPEGLELCRTYTGTDADGQTWQALYELNGGALAETPLWCSAQGWLYEYTLEDAGLGTDALGGDFDAKRDLIGRFLTHEINAGRWPDLPLDWTTLEIPTDFEDSLFFSLRSTNYEYYMGGGRDVMAVTDYRSIGTDPDNWAPAEALAALLETLASSDQAPADTEAASAPDETGQGSAPDISAAPGGDTSTPDSGTATAPDENAASALPSGPVTVPITPPPADSADRNGVQETPGDKKGGGKTLALGILIGAAGCVLLAAVFLLGRRSAARSSAPAGRAASFCPRCGSPVPPDAPSCPVCGKTLK